MVLDHRRSPIAISTLVTHLTFRIVSQWSCIGLRRIFLERWKHIQRRFQAWSETRVRYLER